MDEGWERDGEWCGRDLSVAGEGLVSGWAAIVEGVKRDGGVVALGLYRDRRAREWRWRGDWKVTGRRWQWDTIVQVIIH